MGDVSSRCQAFVDQVWADTFGITVDDVRRPGIRVVTDAPGFAGYAGVYILRLGDAVLISAPPDVAPLGLALGPSAHAYLHRDDFSPGAADGRRMTDDDAAAVAAFRAAVPGDEWHEGGFGDDLPDDTWLATADDAVVAMGNLTAFAGRDADVGLVTHPAHRGAGHATRLATAMLAACFDDGVEVVRYRALATNVGSLAVARRLGFERYGENVAVRLTQSR